MRTAPFLVASAFGLVSVIIASAPAQSKVRVVPYSKVGNWSIRAVYGSKGPFDHCSANARYQSGTRVSIIVYRSSNWRLWFAHNDWPDRGRAKFPATVQVDGRTVLSRAGNYKGRNAYIDLGRDVSRVKALMRGRSMAIITPAGTSRFSLTGTRRATIQVARCWKAHYRAVPSTGGAFGSANNNNNSGGAFGSAAPAKPSANELSRANTLEIATSYLSKASQPYSILPVGKSPLKHFPVNWKLQDGSIGGMRVFKNTSAPVSRLLGTLLSDQAKNCKGRNASTREPLKNVRGRNMARARGVCELSSGKIVNIDYKVAELGRRLIMVVMEMSSGGKAPVRQPGSANVSPNGGALSDQEIHVPGPNEL